MLLHPLLLLPSIFPSIRVFSNESAFHIKGPKYWSFSINPSNDYYTWLVWSPCSPSDSQESSPALQFESISFSALSILYGPALAFVHDSWKTIALTVWIFVSKVMSLLLNRLSRFVIAFLPRSKCLLISWLQSLSTVILEPKKIKSVSYHFFPFYSPCSDGTRCLDLHFLDVEF